MSETKPPEVFSGAHLIGEYGNQPFGEILAKRANTHLAPLVEALERMKLAHESFKAGTGHGCDYTGEVVAVLAAWEKLRAEAP